MAFDTLGRYSINIHQPGSFVRPRMSTEAKMLSIRVYLGFCTYEESKHDVGLIMTSINQIIDVAGIKIY